MTVDSRHCLVLVYIRLLLILHINDANAARQHRSAYTMIEYFHMVVRRQCYFHAFAVGCDDIRLL